MGINNIGVGIRSNSQNSQFGNISTVPVITTDTMGQIRNAPVVGTETSPSSQIQNIQGVQGAIVVNQDIREAANNRGITQGFNLSGEPSTIAGSRFGFQNPPGNLDEEALNRRYSVVDTLQLSSNTINGTGFSTSSLQGFSASRPEIISLIDYEPIFKNHEEPKFTDVGYFIDYKYQINELRKNTLSNVINSLNKNEITKKALLENQKAYKDFITVESNKLNSIGNLISIFDMFDKAFQVREISNEFFNINNLLTLKEFFTTKMNFKETSYNTFSDTKLLYQLLFDLRNAAESYSINLLDLQDPNRTNDLNSVVIDTSYTTTRGFSFSLNQISTPQLSSFPKSATLEQNFNGFLNSLPALPVDRTKVLMQTLNKIFRASRGLSKPSVKNSLSNNFSVSTDNNPFDNIIGVIPNDIFTTPLGNGTIASTLILKDAANPNLTVLPFEATIVDDGETTYAPGNIYFKEIALANISLAPLANYSDNFSSKVANTTFILENIFDFYQQGFQLLPNNFSMKYFGAIKNTLNYVNTYQTSGAPAKESLIIPALINFSLYDRTLKHYLFQFLLLLGMASSTSSSEKALFKNLKKELKSTSVFTALTIPAITLDPLVDQSSQLRAAALDLANEITKYVTQTLINNSTLTLDQNASLTPRQRSDENLNVFLDNPNLISRLLTETVNATVSNKPNLFKDFIDIIVSLDQDSMIAGNSDSYLNSNSFTTKYGNISLSYLLLLNFEIICSLTKRYVPVDFDSENGRLFGIIYNKDNCLAAQKGIERTIKETPTSLVSFATEISMNIGVATAQTQNNKSTPTSREIQRRIDGYYDISKKTVDALIGEDTFLKNAIGIFNVISTNLNNAKKNGQEIFNRLVSDPSQVSFVRSNRTLLKKTQYRIAESSFRLLANSSESSLLNPLAFNITDDEYYHLLSLNKKMKSLSGERTKLISVALPNGFIDSIRGRVSKTSAISGQQQIVDLTSTNSLINVVVYRKSLLDEEIVFKPKKFVFDTSVFVGQYPKELTIDPFGSFNDQSGLVTLEDKTSILSPKQITKNNIQTYSRYTNVLNASERAELFENHVKDYLFSKYISLYSGLKLSEEVFPASAYKMNQNTNNSNQFISLYLKTLGIEDNRSVKEILADELTPVAVKDNINLLLNFSTQFKTEFFDSVLFAEKLFDRIFTIQINIDNDFEIDTELTRRRVLENDSVRKRIKTVNGALFMQDLNGATMDEFYTSIEVVSNNV